MAIEVKQRNEILESGLKEQRPTAWRCWDNEDIGLLYWVWKHKPGVYITIACDKCSANTDPILVPCIYVDHIFGVTAKCPRCGKDLLIKVKFIGEKGTRPAEYNKVKFYQNFVKARDGETIHLNWHLYREKDVAYIGIECPECLENTAIEIDASSPGEQIEIIPCATQGCKRELQVAVDFFLD